MLFNGGFAEPWRIGEARESKLVFIGKNLDAKALAARFNACLATPENMKKKADALRFVVGDRVECKTGCHAWSPGTVVALNYRDTSPGSRMSPGMVAPYQISLDVEEGEPEHLIWAPVDDDRVIRVLADDNYLLDLPSCDDGTEQEESDEQVESDADEDLTGHAHEHDNMVADLVSAALAASTGIVPRFIDSPISTKVEYEAWAERKRKEMKEQAATNLKAAQAALNDMSISSGKTAR